MLVINEWLPNPSGSDREGEWLELRNTGESPIELSDWSVVAGGKTFPLSGYRIEARSLLLLSRGETGLSLRNIEGQVTLKKEGEELESISFLGTAPEGQSFGRIGENFLFLEPTPGAENRATVVEFVGGAESGAGMLVGQTYSHGELAGIILGVACIITCVMYMGIRNHENLQKLFFGTN